MGAIKFNHENPDVICLCETWLNKNILNNEILPSNNKVYRCDRGDGYGGVLIGVTNDISSDLIDTPSNLAVPFYLNYLTTLAL